MHTSRGSQHAVAHITRKLSRAIVVILLARQNLRRPLQPLSQKIPNTISNLDCLLEYHLTVSVLIVLIDMGLVPRSFPPSNLVTV
jgi:hypothetical protein